MSYNRKALSVILMKSEMKGDFMYVSLIDQLNLHIGNSDKVNFEKWGNSYTQRDEHVLELRVLFKNTLIN